MKRRLLPFAFFLLLPILPLSRAVADNAAQPTADTIQAVAARMRPSLVRIHVVLSTTNGGRETRSEAYGSGVIISKDGYILTNHHVAGLAKWISVTLADNHEVDAVMVGTDPLSDLTVIKIAGGPYVPAAWGDDSKLRVGDPVMALGSPLAFSECVTAGVVSNTQLVITEGFGSALTINGADIGSIVRWIAHDAPIYSGNSGGALVNLRGEVVGINEMEIGLSGAIPVSIARPVAEELIKSGQIKRAYTGLELQPRPRGAESGVLVAGVLPHSPAETAGVKPGDVLLAAGGIPLDAAFMEQLPPVNLAILSWPIGVPVKLDLRRGGTAQSLSLIPAQRVREDTPEIELPGWDLTATEITPMTALEAQLPGQSGLYVTGVAEGGAGATAAPPIEAGDVILKFNGQAVNSLDQVVKATAAIPRSAEGRSSVVELYRAGERLLTVVRVNRVQNGDSSVEVAKAWLPIATQVVTPTLAQALKLPNGTQGVRVTRLLDSTTGAKLNLSLQVGDVIVRLDDDAVEATSPEDSDIFEAMVRQYRIGSTVKVRLLRGGRPLTVLAKTLPAPKQERELPTYTDTNFGLTVRPISYWDKVNGSAGIAGQGVYVANVVDGSWAALAGLTTDSILLQVDGKPVYDLAAAKAAFAAVAKAQAAHTTFFICSGVHTSFLDAKTPWSTTGP